MILSNLAFSLVLIAPGTIEYTAQFPDLKACEAEVQRLTPQLKDSGSIVACMPVNTVSHENIDRHLDDMLTMLRRMRERMAQDMSQTEK